MNETLTESPTITSWFDFFNRTVGPSPSPTDNDVPIDYFLGGVALVCIVVGVTLNTAVIPYFISKTRQSSSRTLANIFYTIISATDLTVSLLSIFYTTTLFTGQPGAFKSVKFCIYLYWGKI